MADRPFELGHWHPVLLERDLGARPKVVMLHGRELVVFRTTSGAIAALGNTCPHRRARLSEGWVEGDAIVCAYHGFCFAKDGTGTSSGTPRMHLAADRYDVATAWDAVWVRAYDGTRPALPTVGREGFRHIATLTHDVECGLEPLVDNFSEVEHTPTTHALFGYRRDALPDVRVHVELGPEHVRVLNEGPQKPLPRLIERAFGLRSGDTFIDDWTVRFSPVHIVYDQWWRDPSDTPRAERIHLGVFFTPIDRDETRMTTIVFSNRRASALDVLLVPLIRAIVNREIALDRSRVERLADQSPDLRGTRLGRFDAPLRELRKRIEAIYRGRVLTP